MTRKIRNLAGEPVGAKEADREIRRLWREREKERERKWAQEQERS